MKYTTPLKHTIRDATKFILNTQDTTYLLKQTLKTMPNDFILKYTTITRIISGYEYVSSFFNNNKVLYISIISILCMSGIETICGYALQNIFNVYIWDAFVYGIIIKLIILCILGLLKLHHNHTYSVLKNSFNELHSELQKKSENKNEILSEVKTKILSNIELHLHNPDYATYSSFLTCIKKQVDDINFQ